MAKPILTQPMAEAMAQQLVTVSSTKEFFYLIGKHHEKLTKIPPQKRWNIFRIPKKKGGHRTIENPCDELKDFHRSFNRHLQCLYALLQPECSYGFITAVQDLPVKNIYTNACRHLQKPYLINFDIKDFFQNTQEMEIVKLFQSAPFNYDEELSKLLANLCCCNGHLATGAPTSPVLSNFVSLELDAKLNSYCQAMGITYTRFVDDLTFSADFQITEDMLSYILDCIKAENQQLNPEKVKYYGPAQIKEVTGLILREKPDVSPEFLTDLKVTVNEISEYKRIKEWVGLSSGYKNMPEPKAMKTMMQAAEGGLNFLKNIRGAADAEYQSLKSIMQRAEQMNPYLLHGYYSLTF